MNESKLIKHLPTIGRIFTPAAMLVVLTYEISTSQDDITGAWVWAILAGAAATAVGVEAVGILAGHTFEAYWRAGDNGRARLALALLGVYTVAGLVILWGNWALMPIPIIAAVVYLVSGLAESLTVRQAKEAANDERLAAFELEQQAKDREWQRQLEAKKLEIEAQNTLQIQLAHEKAQAEIAIAVEKTKATIANAEARKAKAKGAKEVAKAPEAVAETKVNHAELSGSKLEIYKLFRQKPDASNTEIAETVGVSRQYVGQVKKELNGSLAS